MFKEEHEVRVAVFLSMPWMARTMGNQAAQAPDADDLAGRFVTWIYWEATVRV